MESSIYKPMWLPCCIASSQMFFSIGVLKNFVILIVIHLCWSLFDKVAGLQACNFIKKALKNTSGGYFWIVKSPMRTSCLFYTKFGTGQYWSGIIGSSISYANTSKNVVLLVSVSVITVIMIIITSKNVQKQSPGGVL